MNSSAQPLSKKQDETPQYGLLRPAADAPRPEPRELSLLQAISRWLKYNLGSKSDSSLKEALEEAIEEHEVHSSEQMPPEEKIMLHNVLSFADIKVSDIMVPRTDIAAVPHNVSLTALKAHLIEQRHTRIPVYKDTLDQMQGFIHVKDLLPMLSGDKTFDLTAVTRQLIFVPPSMRIIDLLIEMRHAGSHMAIVVDEYGGSDGLVTMEDLFEEIVGDIQDEHDEDEDRTDTVQRIDENTYEVSARIPVGKLEQQLGLKLVTEEKENEFDTLGGFIFFQLGRVPARGEIISHVSGAHFEIIDADSRRIRKVRISSS